MMKFTPLPADILKTTYSRKEENAKESSEFQVQYCSPHPKRRNPQPKGHHISFFWLYHLTYKLVIHNIYIFAWGHDGVSAQLSLCLNGKLFQSF